MRIDIDGVVHTGDVVGGISIEKLLNERHQATFTCNIGYLPDREKEVLIYADDNVTALFGGLITSRSVSPIEFGSVSSFTEIECSDFFTYLDWAVTSASYGSPVTMKTVLQDFISGPLASYGFTLDAGQPNGPTLAAFEFSPNTFVSDALRQLLDRCEGYVARLSPTKVLSVKLLGADPAPFSIVTAAPHCQDLRWIDSRETPKTRVVLICGPSSGEFIYTGTRTTDGVSNSYTFDVRGAYDPWNVQIGSLYYDVGPASAGRHLNWDHDTFTLSSGTVSLPSLGAGLTITVLYYVKYPFEIVKTTGAAPYKTHLAISTGILDVPSGLEAATVELAKVSQTVPRVVDVVSFDIGWDIGQLLTIAVPSVTGTFYITDVTITKNSDHVLFYRFSATESSKYPGSYLDDWREFAGGGGSTTSVVGAVVPTTLATPVYLGGSTSEARSSTSYQAIPNHTVYAAKSSYTGQIRVRLRAHHAAVTATSRLVSLYADDTVKTVIGTSDGVTSQTTAEKTFLVNIVSGERYRQEIVSSAVGESVFAESAQLEAV